MSTKAQQVNEEELTTGDSELPEGWSLACLDELCDPPQYGWTTSAKRDGQGLKLLRTTDISSENVNWNQVPFCEDEPPEPAKYLLDPGDIVVSRAGSVGLSYMIRECPPTVFASYLIRFRPIKPVTSEFISTFLKSPQYWFQIADETLGIAIPNVNGSKLRKLRVPLPPLVEQERICTSVRKALSGTNAVRRGLARTSSILLNFRQAVLAAACSGKLTEDWRERHSNVTPIQNYAVESDLPKTWYWSKLRDCAVLERGRFSIRPRNDPAYYGGKYPFVQIGDLPSDGGDIKEFHQTLNERGLAVSKMFLTGTVLVAIVGATIGNTGVLTFDSCCPDSLIAIRGRSIMHSRFIEYYLRSKKLEIRDTSYASGGQPNINLQTLYPYPVPLAPDEEISVIVSRTEALFKLADAIEKRVAAASARAEHLTQAVLAKAFRGELVPTEAELARKEGREYEPASVLLERIRAQKEITAAKQTKKKNR